MGRNDVRVTRPSHDLMIWIPIKGRMPAHKTIWAMHSAVPTSPLCFGILFGFSRQRLSGRSLLPWPRLQSKTPWNRKQKATKLWCTMADGFGIFCHNYVLRLACLPKLWCFFDLFGMFAPGSSATPLWGYYGLASFVCLCKFSAFVDW